MLVMGDRQREIRQVTDAIGHVVSNGTGLSGDGIAAIHERFVQLVVEVNERLRSCDELLRRGLRGEAIQEAEDAPPILELVAELDIPVWDAWADRVRQLGLPPQPPLLVGIAAELEAAYLESRKLERLLRNHRLHALARSPLRERLTVLRALAEKDASNPCWRDDLARYEQARVREIEREAQTLIAEQDREGLAALTRELEASGWTIAVPAELVRKVRCAWSRLERRWAREQLAELEPEMVAAFSAFDVDRAIDIMYQWEYYSEKAALRQDEELVLRVETAIKWVREEQELRKRRREHDQAVASLERMLDDSATRQVELRQRFHDIERLGQPLSERMVRRYEARIRAFELARTRRCRLVVGSCLAGLAVLVAVMGMIIVSQHQADRRETAVRRLRRLVREHRHDAADAFIRNLSREAPALAELPEVRAMKIEVERERRQLTLTREEIRVSLSTLGSLAATPSTRQRLRQARAELERVRRKLKETRRLDPLEEEHLEVERMAAQIEREWMRLQDHEDQQFRNGVRELTRNMQSMEDLERPQLEELLSRAEALRQRRYVSDSVRQASEIGIKVRAIRDRIRFCDQLRRRHRLLTEIERMIGQGPAYYHALQKYVKEFPEGRRSRQFRQGIDGWQREEMRIARWNELADQWNRMSLDQSVRLVMISYPLVREIKDNFSGYPGASKTAPVADYLASAVNRLRGRSGDLTVFSKTLEHDLFSLQSIELKSSTGKTDAVYFQDVLERRANGHLTVSRLLDVSDWSRKKETRIAIARLEKRDDGQVMWPAPQNALARRCREVLNNRSLSWEEKICRLLETMLADCRTDPILRFQLIAEILKRGRAGSTLLDRELAGFQSQLPLRVDAPEVRKANWFVGDDGPIDQLRIRIGKGLQKIAVRPLAIYTQRVRPKLEELRRTKPKLLPLKWVAIALRSDRDGEWRCLMSDTQQQGRSGKLVVRDVQNGSATWLVVGALEDGTARLDRKAIHNLREGQPLYLMELIDHDHAD